MERKIKRDKGMKEYEVKRLISKNTYCNLRKAQEWDSSTLQVNYYYSNSIILNKQNNITIRIRSIKNYMTLQIKEVIEDRNGLRICEEHEKRLFSIPSIIPQDVIRELSEAYSLGDVYLQGFMVTERMRRKVGEIEIALGRNFYNGQIDYEIELEGENYLSTKELLRIMGLESHEKNVQSKFSRFRTYMNI